jgi:type IV secretory pathway TraG/TraD family ATPase VirD4
MYLLLLILLFIAWQSVAALLGVIIFIVVRYYKLPTIVLWLLSFSFVFSSELYNFVNLPANSQTILNSLKVNITFWKLMFKSNLRTACYYLIHYDWYYLATCPFLMASFLHHIDKLTTSPHAERMKEMAQSKLPSVKKISRNRIDRILQKTKDEDYDGIVLGASLITGKRVIMPDYYVNQLVLVLGTTGAGKTITLRRFIKRALLKGYPLIIVDGKPTTENVNFAANLAKEHNRTFYGFNCGELNSYNPFSHGGYTELKDKIITLKDRWDNDYYRTVASDYLQTAIEVLIKSGQEITLRSIASCLEFENLTLLLRENKNDELIEKVKSLEQYDRNALTGLQAHLNLLANSELGKYFDTCEHSFTLQDIMDNNGAVYFALPALKFPDFAKTLGKLVINDIKSVIEPLESSSPIFLIFDEFSVFAGDQVLNLINMGRGKGLHTVLGTQGLADLKRVDPEFESQLLNCVNTIICHRLNHQQSAETISKWIGTTDSYDLTAQIDLKNMATSLGSASANKAFIVHPDDIKQRLCTGETIFVCKINDFGVDRIKIAQ